MYMRVLVAFPFVRERNQPGCKAPQNWVQQQPERVRVRSMGVMFPAFPAYSPDLT